MRSKQIECQRKHSRSRPHKMCVKCEAISLPERSSDWWVCCQCKREVLYNPAKYARVKYQQTLRRGIQIEEFYLMCSMPPQPNGKGAVDEAIDEMDILVA